MSVIAVSKQAVDWTIGAAGECDQALIEFFQARKLNVRRLCFCRVEESLARQLHKARVTGLRHRQQGNAWKRTQTARSGRRMSVVVAIVLEIDSQRDARNWLDTFTR